MPKKIKIKKAMPSDFDIAMQYFQSDNLQQAETICRLILQREPNHPDVLHLIGLIAGQSRQYSDAINYISKAIRIKPHVYPYYNNPGLAFKFKNRLDEAIENLDLVITIDTAIAHLSGALGKKTWILLPAYAEWRWHLDMDYSPWYEDVRLFRHKEPGKKDWKEMMERVKRYVEAEIKRRKTIL